MEVAIQLLEVVIWPVAASLIVLILKTPIGKIIDRFSTADNLEASIGPLTIQANAMREIHQSIQTGFPESTLRKAEVEALIDTKIRSVQATMEHELTKTNVRNYLRVTNHQSIRITTENGNTFDGETIDISDAGIGFRSSARFCFHQIVSITPAVEGQEKWPGDKVRIVRVDQYQEGFYYGASVPEWTPQNHVARQPDMTSPLASGADSES